MFEGKTIEELDALMVELKIARKMALAKEQAEADAMIRENLSELEKGDPIRILYKGEEIEALFEKLTDKRATVTIDGVKRSILLDKILSVA